MQTLHFQNSLANKIFVAVLTSLHLCLFPSFFYFLFHFLCIFCLSYSLLRHVDDSLWSSVAGSGKVVTISLHANGLQPVLHCAHSRGRLRAPWLQQGGVGSLVGGGQKRIEN